MNFQNLNCSTIPIPVVPPVPTCALPGIPGEQGEKGENGDDGKGLRALVSTNIYYLKVLVENFISAHNYRELFPFKRQPKFVYATVECSFPTHCYVTMNATQYKVSIKLLKNTNKAFLLTLHLLEIY
jgi:hypothetical protein